METIAASKLRANLMQILKKIEQGASLTITSRGRPVAQLTPPPETTESAMKALAKLGKTAVIGDIITPIDEPWQENP